MRRAVIALGTVAGLAILLALAYSLFFDGYSFSEAKAVQSAVPGEDVQIRDTRSFGDWSVLIGESGGKETAWAVKRKWGFLYEVPVSSALSASIPSGELERTWASVGSAAHAYRTMFAVRTDDPSIAKVIVTHEVQVSNGALPKGTAVFAEMDVTNGFGATMSIVPMGDAGSFMFHGLDAAGHVLFSDT